GNPTTAGTYTFTVQATDATGATDAETFTITVADPQPQAGAVTIGNGSTLPLGQRGHTYNVTLTATGGTPGYTWSLLSGALPAQHNPAPPLVATPRAQCGPGSRREPGIQGRVPAGSATDGLTCNAEQVAHQGKSGGFKTWRYVDTNGHTCAFYDTALLFPLNAFKVDSSSVGVAVLD